LCQAVSLYSSFDNNTSFLNSSVLAAVL
jgi:hypothetical protein